MKLERPGVCEACDAAGDDRPKRLIYDPRSGVSVCYSCAGGEDEEPPARAAHRYREDPNPYGYEVDPCSDPEEEAPRY